LYQVKEEAGKKGTTTFAHFKCAVWHESFKKLLETIKYHSKTGFIIVCSDRIERCLFLFIVILSADYEEQYVRSPLITKLPNNILDV
jgi:Plavaka transposase